MQRVEVGAKLAPRAVNSAEYRLARAAAKIVELEAELDVAVVVEPDHAAASTKKAPRMVPN
jgi:hypothetical protein